MVSGFPLVFDTIYIGGGTPSVLSGKDIGRIVGNAFTLFDILHEPEITIEVNPGTVTLEKLRDYRSAGINRINIGVQSFYDANLDFLGRIHTGKEAGLAIDCARKAEFRNVGIDLIYGIPGQTKELWLSDLHRAVGFGPEHISCYMLTWEKGTPLYRDYQVGRVMPVPDGRMADFFKATINFLESNGYLQYEISNFARSISKRSKHNLKYWSFLPYIGLGPSAHSYVEQERYWNFRRVKKYMKSIEEGRLPIEEKEIPTKEQFMIEAVYLGLRKTEGLDIGAFNKRFGVKFNEIFETRIRQLERDGYLHYKRDENRCMLSKKGILFLDSISSEFSDIAYPYGQVC